MGVGARGEGERPSLGAPKGARSQEQGADGSAQRQGVRHGQPEEARKVGLAAGKREPRVDQGRVPQRPSSPDQHGDDGDMGTSPEKQREEDASYFEIGRRQLRNDDQSRVREYKGAERWWVWHGSRG